MGQFTVRLCVVKLILFYISKFEKNTHTPAYMHMYEYKCVYIHTCKHAHTLLKSLLSDKQHSYHYSLHLFVPV